MRQYYALAGVTAGMREGTTFSWFLTDHLGSVVAVVDSAGAMVSTTRYSPFGDIRTDVGTVSQTDYGYTFQRNVSGMGLMDYKARYYSSLLGRFIQPDTKVVEPFNPQSYNRFSYVNNRPINYRDPTGHAMVVDDGGSCSGIYCLQKGTSNSLKSSIDLLIMEDDSNLILDSDLDLNLPQVIDTQIPLPTLFPETPDIQPDENVLNDIQECNKGQVFAGIALIAFTDLFIGIPLAAVIVFTGGVTPPAILAEVLEVGVVLPATVFGIYLISESGCANEEK